MCGVDEVPDDVNGRAHHKLSASHLVEVGGVYNAGVRGVERFRWMGSGLVPEVQMVCRVCELKKGSLEPVIRP